MYKYSIINIYNGGDIMYYFAICDDDMNDLLTTKTFLNDFLILNNIKEYEIIEFCGGVSLLNSPIEFDIIFLDVMLKEEKNGIDFAKLLLKKDIKSKFIFISNSVDFAPESFKVKALGYIRKPLIKSDFFNYMQEILKDLLYNALYFEDKNVKIKFKNIIFIEVIHKKTIIHTLYDEFYFNKSLTCWLDELINYNFCRTHNSFIVNLKYIKKIRQNNILLKDESVVPLSRTYKNHLKFCYTRYLGDQF